MEGIQTAMCDPQQVSLLQLAQLSKYQAMIAGHAGAGSCEAPPLPLCPTASSVPQPVLFLTILHARVFIFSRFVAVFFVRFWSCSEPCSALPAAQACCPVHGQSPPFCPHLPCACGPPDPPRGTPPWTLTRVFWPLVTMCATPPLLPCVPWFSSPLSVLVLGARVACLPPQTGLHNPRLTSPVLLRRRGQLAAALPGRPHAGGQAGRAAEPEGPRRCAHQDRRQSRTPARP